MDTKAKTQDITTLPETHTLEMYATDPESGNEKLLQKKGLNPDSPLFEMKWMATHAAGEAVALAHIIRCFCMGGDDAVKAMPLTVRTKLRDNSTNEVVRETHQTTAALFEAHGGLGCVMRGRSMYIEAHALANGMQVLCRCLEQAVEAGAKDVDKAQKEAKPGQMEA